MNARRWLVTVAALFIAAQSLAKPPSGDPAPTQVAVIGGGLAGLVTAYELRKKGVKVHLLEASDLLGGRVQTADYGPGLRAEYGMQEIWENNPLVGIARELKVGLDQGEYSYSSMVIDGKLFPFTQDTPEAFLATVFSKEELAAREAWLLKAKRLHDVAHTEGLKNAEVKALQDKTFKQWLEDDKVSPRVATWIRLTIECELGSDWDDFSALFGLLEFDVFFRGTTRNYHVQGGNSRLIEALGKALDGAVTLSARVTTVRREQDASGKVKAYVTYMDKNHVRTLVADRVVAAVPFVQLHQIQFEPALPKEVWDSVGGLSYGQYVVVHFLMEKAGNTVFGMDPHELFTVLTKGPLGVVYGVAEKSPESNPRHIFGLLIYGEPAREFHMSPREEKMKEVLGELDTLWPGFSKHVKDTHVYSYHPAAIPVWGRTRSPIDEKSELLRKPAMGVWFAGDYTENAHADGAARSGQRVAKAIAAELGKP